MEAYRYIMLYMGIFFIIAIIGDRLWTKSQRKYFKEDIKEKYGSFKNYKKRAKVDRENLETYFRKVRDEEDFYIDNITWHDLNMDEIFKIIGNVQSSVGNEVLYKILRIPLFNKKKLDERESLIEFLRENPKERLEIQYLIRCMVGKLDNANISKYFNNENKIEIKSGIKMLIAMRYITLIALIFAIITTSLPSIIFLMMMVSCNMQTIYKARKKNNYKLDDYSYLICIIKCAFKIRDLNLKEIDEKYRYIDNYLEDLKKIKNGKVGDMVFKTSGSNGILKAFIDVLFLGELVDFQRIQEVALKKPDAIRKIYEYVGELDAFTGAASFKSTIGFFVKPEFTEEKAIDIEELYNPIIEKPILNSIKDENSILLTGSNASGKSTFLRSVGINIILAQSLNMACAKKYKGSMFRLMSSMALADDIIGGESYYMVEIKSIKRILNKIDKEDFKIFCIVDEILRGTNTAERISAATGILKYLQKQNTYTLAATHDIELTYILEDIYANYSFEEKIENNDIVFDYKIKKGRAKTRNAIKILEFIGYDKEILDEAKEMSKNFLSKTNWDKI